MNTSNYHIRTISSSKPMHAENIGKIRGLSSFIIADHPHLFVLEAAGRYYTIEYRAPKIDNVLSDVDELNEFIEVVKPFIVWDLIV